MNNTARQSQIAAITASDSISPDCKVRLVARPKRHRIWELDFMRGFCILLMILDHLSILIWMEFGSAWCDMSWVNGGWHFASDSAFLQWLCNLCYNYYGSDLRYYGHPIVLFFFFSICGISSTLSRNNFKRGVQLALVATIYSVISYIGQYVLGIGGIFVHFGVLNMLATCILLYSFISFLCFNNKKAKMLVSLAIVVVVLCLYHCLRPDKPLDGIYAFLFSSDKVSDYGMPIDFEHHYTTLTSFSPGDWFPLVPWSAFFFWGTAEAPFLYGERKSLLPWFDKKWNRPVCFVGRHALFIYVSHVILLGALLMLISYLFITPGNWVLF